MANSDELWFELGVRDRVSNRLVEIMQKAEQLKDTLGGMEIAQTAIRNAAELERALDKIAVARTKIADAKTSVVDPKSIENLNNMDSALDNMQKKFLKFIEMSNDLDIAKMGSKGFAKFLEEQNNLQLAFDQVNRKVTEYIKTAKNATDANDKMFEKAISDLDKFNAAWDKMNTGESRQSKLVREMKQQLEIEKNNRNEEIGVSAGARTGFDELKQQEELRQLKDYITRKYDEELQKQREQQANEEKINQILSERKQLKESKEKAAQEKEDQENYEIARQINEELARRKQALSANAAVYSTLNKLRKDTENQQTVAHIQKQTASYTALQNKITAINDLMKRVANERSAMKADPEGYGEQIYTKERIMQRLEAIQRRYNEELAVAKQKEKEDADEKNKNAEATKRVTTAIQQASQANRSLVASYNNVSESLKGTNMYMDQFLNQMKMYASLYGLERLAKSIVTIGGQFEYQHMALQNILGDVEAANTIFSQLQGLALESPKTFKELTEYVKQLSAYQIPAEELYDTTKRLADMSSGLGVDMSRLILAYGQVRSAAVLRGQELRQFTEAGIPIVQALANKFTELNGRLTTTSEVFELISKRAVPFEMVKEILWDMTDQGGKFYNMQGELADTLYGKWQKLQDQWQITLGHIADGNSRAGAFFRTVIEELVKVVSLLDTALPLIGMTMIGRGLAIPINNGIAAADKQSGATAIRNMQITKLKEANRLERERVMYGRVLTQQEQDLVRLKSQLVSRDYILLAQMGELSKKKTEQLISDGKISAYSINRLAIERGITHEKLKQMTMQERAAAVGMFPERQGFWKRTGQSALSFMGGGVGLGMTAAFAGIGAIMSIYESYKQKQEELAQKSKAMAATATQGFNTLQTALDNLGADTSIEKRIKALEDTLIGLGDAGKAVVAASREHMDDINKRWETLKEGAEKYKEVLDAFGSDEGKAIFEEAIDKSDIEENIKAYDDAINEAAKYEVTVQKYEATFKKAIYNITKDNEELANSIKDLNLFEQIKALGQQRVYNELYANRNNTYSKGAASSAIGVLNTYFNKQIAIQNKWKEIQEESIPALNESARTLAVKTQIENDPKGIEQMVRQFVAAFGDGSKQARDLVAQEMANTEFHIDIIPDVSNIKSDNLAGFSGYVWNKFGGKFLTDKDASDKDTINIAGNIYTRAQANERFKDIEAYKKDTNKELDKLKKEKADFRKAGDIASADETLKKYNKLKAELDALNLYDPKNNGKKEDVLLKRWREEWGELKAFYTEFKKWAKDVGDDEAIKKLRESGLWGGLFNSDGSLKYNIKNWEEAISQFEKKLSGGSPERDKLKFEVGKEKLTPQYDRMKESAESILNDLDKALKEQGQKWNLYKKIFDATGNRQMASSVAFGKDVDFTNRAQELRSQLAEDLLKNPKSANLSVEQVMGMSDKELRDYDIFKESTNGIYVKMQELRTAEKELKQEETNLFLDALKNAGSLETELDIIKAKYDRTREAINANYSKPEQAEERDRLLKNADNNQAREEAGKQWEWYKKSEDWGVVFGNLDKVSTKTLRTMRENLISMIPSIKENVESMKALEEAIDKIEKNLNTRNPFKAIGDAMESVASVNELRMNGRYGDSYRNAEGNYIIQEADAKKMGLKVKKDNTYNEEDLKNANRESSEKMKDAANKIATNIMSLTDLTEAVGLQNTEFGERIKEFGEGVSHFSNAAQKWSQGDYVGAVAEAIKGVQSIGSFIEGVGGFSFNNSNEESVKDSINELTKENAHLSTVIEKATEEISKYNGARVVESANQALRLQNQKEENIREKYREGMGYHGAHHSNAYYWDVNEADVNTINQMLKQKGFNEAIDTSWESLINLSSEALSEIRDNLYGLWEGLKGQGYYDWVGEFLDELADESGSKEKILEEVKSKLTTLTVSGLHDSIVSELMDSSKDVKSFGKDLTKTLTQAVLSAQIGNLIDDDLKKWRNDMYERMKSHGGSLTEADVEALQQGYKDIVERAQDIRNEVFRVTGYNDQEDSSLTSSIKNVTEQTADILAAYINAIRADVAVNRNTLIQILNSVQAQSVLPVIAEAQLAQLQTLVSLARDRNQVIESIRDVLSQSQNGVRPLKIVM